MHEAIFSYVIKDMKSCCVTFKIILRMRFHLYYDGLGKRSLCLDYLLP